MTWRSCVRTLLISTALTGLIAGCGGTPEVDVSKLDIGTYSTALRTADNQPSPQAGTFLEGVRMADAVADTSQFGSPLVYLWQADPIPDTASLGQVLGEAGRHALDANGWVAGYRASYADKPKNVDGSAPPGYVGMGLLLFRFPENVAARAAAQALEVANWKDFAQTVAVPLPAHPDITARYTPGAGALMMDVARGPFVLHVMVEAPPDGIQNRVADLDPLLDTELPLIDKFHPTPAAEIPALPPDPDGLLARMVSTDPKHWPAPAGTFADYGATGALRGQTPAMRKGKSFEKWGVERLAVSGNQQLFKAKDHRAALDMLSGFAAELSGKSQQFEADAIPDEHCFKLTDAAPGSAAFACQIVHDDVYTMLRSDTATSAKQMAAAQYALLVAKK
jgi:hypothetical protein